MNAALWLALAFSSKPSACQPCHPAIVEAFLKTGMGRSIAERPAPSRATFYHRLSNRHYTIADGKMRRHQLDNAGREINIVEKTIDFAIGSGNHASTYVHRSPEGRLLQLPVSNYALDGWAMSPGYDRFDHLDFRREVTPQCLFCHSNSAVPEPIACSRCHGSTDAHLAKPSRGTVLNPARLEPARQLDMCLQCHLETTSGEFPDSLRRPGRDVFSFRPGEPLAAHKTYFDRADGKDRFEVNHAGYRLLLSECFKQSGGKMTCTTCHDPHSARVKATPCAGCHRSDHSRAATDCAGCHMPKRRTGDAIHVRMTDHRIARRHTLREPDREDHAPYEGDLAIFLGSGQLELARLKQKIDSGRGAEADYRRRVELEPGAAAPLAALAEFLMRAGKANDAAPVIERALRADRNNAVALNALAVRHAIAGNTALSMKVLERARAANPEHPLVWINIGVTHEVQGDRTKAEAAYREAIRLQPDSSEARRRLAALLGGK